MNTPQSSMSAEREMTKFIRHVQNQASGQQSSSVLHNLMLSEAHSEAEGKDALSRLKSFQGRKLPEDDVAIIARRLYDEVQRLKRHLKTRSAPMSMSGFCQKFKIDTSGSSKELHRLTLAPDRDPASVRLRRSADKYYRLIEGMSKEGNRSLNTLADDVLRGTSLHPSAHLGEMNEAEKLANALQAIINNIDREFGLHEKFQKTAALKSEFIKNGKQKFWPLWGWNYDDEEKRSEYLRYASNPKNAYWGKIDEPLHSEITYPEDGFPVPQFNEILQNCDFFHIPHAPIGVVEFANIPRRPKDAEQLPEYEEKIKSFINTYHRSTHENPNAKTHMEEYNAVSDEWDDGLKKPHGQLSHENGIARGTDHAWLIIYPTRDNSRLMPMMYIAYEEGGPYIIPLNARNLEILRDAFWITATEYKSLFDRIKDLLGYLPGQEQFFDKRLRHTLPWFDFNPILKMADDKKKDLNALDDFCQELWNKPTPKN